MTKAITRVSTSNVSKSNGDGCSNGFSNGYGGGGGTVVVIVVAMVVVALVMVREQS